jgi:predicted membrane protein
MLDKSNENKSLITFAQLNKLFLIPFSFIIFNVLSNVFEDLIFGTGVIKNPHFIISIFYDIPYILAGLFHFMSYFKNNKNKNKEPNEDIEQSRTIGINSIYIESIINLYNTNKTFKNYFIIGYNECNK